MTVSGLPVIGAWAARLLPPHWPVPLALGIAILGLPFVGPSSPSLMLAGVAVVLVVMAAVAVRPSLTAVSAVRRHWILNTAALLALTLVGHAWGSFHIAAALDERVPRCADSRFRHFALEIIDEPVLTAVPGSPVVARFTALVAADDDQSCPGLGRHRVRLSWYDPPALARGGRWQAEGKLRPPWSFVNPAGFDYERWLLGAGLHGTGYVRKGVPLPPPRERAFEADPSKTVQGVAGNDNPQRGEGVPFIHHVRRTLSRVLDGYPLRHRALVRGLMLGDDSEITSAQWNDLRRSGTVHLLVVSGLHVGMVAGGLLFLGAWLARLLPPLLVRFGARRVGIAAALAGSGAYVLLSGAGTPAVRAWLMTALALAALGSGRAVEPLQVLGFVFMIVLVQDPLVVHQQGFWLSFGAVGALLGFFQPRRAPAVDGFPRPKGRLVADFVRAQLVLLAVMAPLLAFSQGTVPLVSPLANAIAVPLVTLWVLPLVMASVPLLLWMPTVAGWLLGAADAGLDLVLRVISEAAAVHPEPLALSTPWKAVVLIVCLWHLRFGYGPFRLAALLSLWVGLQQPPGPGLAPGSFRLTVLDVGQGSASLIETRHHRLLFDTGPGYPSGFNLGEAAVIPSFSRLAGTRPDLLIVSHSDADHAGGAEPVMAELEPRKLLRPASFTRFPGLACTAGMGWQWDGVAFRVLNPPAGPGPQRQSDNDGSCVLLVTARDRRVLLPGDISARVERRLEVPLLDVLLSPHHGSRTSSSRAFIERTQPRYVLVEAPRRSRYGHPHEDVLARYRAVGAGIYITGHHGALVWESDRPEEVVRWRERHGAYWHERASEGSPDRQPAAGN